MHPADLVHTLHNLDDGSGDHLLAVVSVPDDPDADATGYEQVPFGIGAEANATGTARALMGSTGLRDRDGLEVFDLDVIETEAEGRPKRLTVRWEAETARYIATDGEGRAVADAWRTAESGRVVGNVYEGTANWNGSAGAEPKS